MELQQLCPYCHASQLSWTDAKHASEQRAATQPAAGNRGWSQSRFNPASARAKISLFFLHDSPITTRFSRQHCHPLVACQPSQPACEHACGLWLSLRHLARLLASVQLSSSHQISSAVIHQESCMHATRHANQQHNSPAMTGTDTYHDSVSVHWPPWCLLM
jgi:hypothetical protein